MGGDRLRLLLDTHTLIWWLEGNQSDLSIKAREAILNSIEVFVSAASLWEVTIKFHKGKLPTLAPLIPNFESEVLHQGFLGLPISLDHGYRAGLLEPLHHDPFDRVMIAQALAEDLTLVSNERLFDRYGVKRLW